MVDEIIEFLKTKPRNMVQNLLFILILHTNIFQIGHYITVHRPQRSTTMFLALHVQSLRKLFKDKGIKEKDFRSDVILIGGEKGRSCNFINAKGTKSTILIPFHLLTDTMKLYFINY